MRTSRGRATSAVAALPALLAWAVAPAGLAENVDPANDGSQHAWSENVGFVNLEPLGDGRDGVEVTDAGLLGWAWSENAGWISFSCANTGSCASVQYGVTNDGRGVLGGHAWAENAGWISFSCRDGGTCATAPYGVTVDGATGAFSGHAWGENVGWIAFATPSTRVVTSWRPPSTCEEPSALDVRPGATPLLVARAPGGRLLLTYEGAATQGRSTYRGTLASLAGPGGHDHVLAACGVTGDRVTLLSPAVDAYFLVVASCPPFESSYGRDSSGLERPPASSPCP